jgi:hypothetical protein
LGDVVVGPGGKYKVGVFYSFLLFSFLCFFQGKKSFVSFDFSPNIIITVLVFLQFLLQIFPKLRYKFAKFQIDSFQRTDKTRPVWFCWFSQKKNQLATDFSIPAGSKTKSSYGGIFMGSV